MKATRLIKNIGLFVLVIAGIAAGADSPPAPTTQPSLPVDWDPVVTDAPCQRMGGASRSAEADPDLFVSVFAPNKSIGLTARSQPVLYWYLSKPTAKKIQISLRPLGKDGTVQDAPAILDLILEGTTQAGVQKLDLAHLPRGGPRAAVLLEPGIQYQWVVEVLVSKVHHSMDPTAECRLMRAANVSAAVSAQLQDASPAGRYTAALKAALWYDALATLNGMIDQDNSNAGLLETRRRLLQREKLLEQGDGCIPGLRVSRH